MQRVISNQGATTSRPWAQSAAEHLQGKLGKLEQLDLSRNKLTELPVTVGNLESLTTLKLAHNQLDDIPHTIGACKNLTYLDASHNRIGHLTSGVCQLTKLRTLVLDANSLTELPRDLFCKCKHLQTLSVHGCRIRPADLETMPAYEEALMRRVQRALFQNELVRA